MGKFKFIPSNRSFAGRLTWWIMFTLLLIMIVTGLAIYSYATNIVAEDTENRFQSLMDVIDEKLDNVLTTVELVSANKVSEIAENLDNRDKLNDVLAGIVRNNDHVLGCGIGFEPDYYSRQGRWYEPYAVRDSVGGVELLSIGGETHDYFQADWYRGGKSAQDGYWTDPYLDADGGKMPLLTYSVPVHDKRSGDVVGVFGIDVSLDWLKSLLSDKDAGDSRLVTSLNKYDAYSFVVGRSGTFIVHPDASKVMHQNFFSQVQEAADAAGAQVVSDMRHGREGKATMTVDGVPSLVFYAPLESSDCSMAIVIPKRTYYTRANLLGVFILGVMGLGLLAIYLICRSAIKRITKPLTRFAESAGEVARGNFDAPLPVIKSVDEIRHLRDSFENMQHSLAHYVDDLQRTTASKTLMERDLKIAREIQDSMLPKQFPPFPDRDDIDIYAQLTPAREVGGDLYDYFIRDEKLFFCIGDVSGKGVPAAIVMAMTRSLFRNISAHEDSPDRILTDLNETLVQGNDSNMFVTMFVGVLELSTGHLLFSNAGHGAPMLIGSGIGWLHCDNNIPVGLRLGWQYTLQEAEVMSRTTIFLYTDGLPEAEDVNHRQFGEPRIVKKVVRRLLEQNRHHPQELIAQITDSVHRFIGDAEPSDDLTMLAIQYNRQTDLLLQQSVVLQGDVSQVPKLAAMVDKVCAVAGIGGVEATQVNLAIEEAVVNVMKYAYQAGERGDVRIEALVRPTSLRFIITDSGQPFDPTSREQVDTTLGTNERGIGGLGIHLVRNLMDEVHYERKGDHNVLTLTKQL